MWHGCFNSCDEYGNMTCHYEWIYENQFYYEECEFFYSWYDMWNQTHNETDYNDTDDCPNWICSETDCLMYGAGELAECNMTNCYDFCYEEESTCDVSLVTLDG
jgi:hypothetical protein